MKHIVVCFDGTWNTLDSPYPTNVVKTAQLAAPMSSEGIAQVIHYDEGVGSGDVAVAKDADRLLGGAFGVGLMNNIERAYRFLTFNYASGDRLFVFGFSRGAFSARSFGGLIRNSGILQREHVGRVKEALKLYQDASEETAPNAPKSCAFRAKYGVPGYFNDIDREWRAKNLGTEAANDQPLTIEYMGVWDTVGAMGVPSYITGAARLNERFRFHDCSLSSSVRSARHAVALDEKRRVFDATLWDNIDDLNQKAGAAALPLDQRPYLQQWFPGDHGSVGGGGEITAISNFTLAWILEGAMRRGLGLDTQRLEALRAESDYRAPVRCMAKPGFDVTAFLTRRSRQGPSAVDLSDLSEFARKRLSEPADKLPNGRPYRPKSLSRAVRSMEGARL